MRTFFFVSSAIAVVASFLVACQEPCVMNDPRPICNAKGAPDLKLDAGFVSTPSDASSD